MLERIQLINELSSSIGFDNVYYYPRGRGYIFIDRPLNKDFIVESDAKIIGIESGIEFYIKDDCIIPRRGWLARNLPVWIWPFGRVVKLNVKRQQS